jgi:hypothetical protein
MIASFSSKGIQAEHEVLRRILKLKKQLRDKE